MRDHVSKETESSETAMARYRRRSKTTKWPLLGRSTLISLILYNIIVSGVNDTLDAVAAHLREEDCLQFGVAPIYPVLPDEGSSKRFEKQQPSHLSSLYPSQFSSSYREHQWWRQLQWLSSVPLKPDLRLRRRLGRGNDNDAAVKRKNCAGWPLFLRLLLDQLMPNIRQAMAIRLLRLDAPQTIRAGQPLKLRCLYDAKNDRLQSLSWYKNGREFYRYQPFERRQPVLAFNLNGVHVDTSKSGNNTVLLANTTSETSGRYKCEATGITFQEVNMELYVNVIDSNSGAISANSINQIMLYLLTIIHVMFLIK